MAIGFNEIPRNLRVPFVYAEFDNSQAVSGPALMPYRALVCGQRRTSGTQPVHMPVRVTSPEQAHKLFGAGSMLAQSCATFLQNDPMTEMWAVATDDAAAGQAAGGTVTLTGAATEGGTIALYIGGRRIRTGVTSGDQASAIATAMAAAINAAADCPVSATAAAGVVTLKALHKGECGNSIDVRLGYYNESAPAGLTVAITAMSGGTANPDVAALIAAMGDVHYNVIVWPWTDAASLTAIESELASRWGPLRMIEGSAISAAAGTHGQLGTLGDSRNSQHLTIMHCIGVPTLTWEVAAAVAGVATYYGNMDPARPFQTLALKGVLPPKESDRLTLQENNLLLYDGISTFSVDDGGVTRVQRLITTYKNSPNGAEDVSYLNLNTILTLGYLRYDFRNYILRKYPRHKLADDGTRYGVGQPVITPRVGKAEAISRARVWESIGLVENVDDFAKAVVCERNAADRDRLDWMLPPDLVNQFRVAGVKISFFL
jgi:phage tail sheath gpL-like